MFITSIKGQGDFVIRQGPGFKGVRVMECVDKRVNNPSKPYNIPSYPHG